MQEEKVNSNINVQNHIFYYVKLKKGNNIHLRFTDGQGSGIITPKDKDGVKMSAEAWHRIKNDPKIELVKEVVRAGSEELVIDEKIHTSMMESYEAQLIVERTKITNRDRIIRRLNRKIDNLKRELGDPVAMEARQALLTNWRNREKVIQDISSAEVLDRIMKLILEKKPVERTKTDKSCLAVARLKKAEISKQIEELPEEKEDEEISEDEVAFDEILKEIELSEEEE